VSCLTVAFAAVVKETWGNCMPITFRQNYKSFASVRFLTISTFFTLRF